ncbi:hypothetical protein ACFYYR_11200 [Streptomyces sp. NPDC001922]|uniref:hypothetical protein n=1 Tax=Streptomyces sp. NPDC001922 TaxID=3364624 RepID=UPI0036D0CED6
MHTLHLAAELTDGSDLKKWILLIAGNVFIVILAVRGIGYYAKREWGELIGHLMAAVVIAGIVYAPNVAVDLFKGIWSKVAGT